jgi:diadenosine tetraphosphatase ApaH/serine/threonine PP2A family protein phosphatase
MKLAILTDLHANREAVQTCLAQARAAGVDRFAFIGDYVGYGADPAWVVDQVRSLVEHEGAVAVLGNHDNATAREPSATMDPEAADASQWTRSQLDASQLKFLGSLPLSATLGHCLFVHANAWAPAEWGYIHSRGDAVRSLQATDRLYTFCGHVHEPRLYHMSATAKVLDFQPVPGVAVPLLPTRRWLVIPGSAGQSRDANPAVCWASFDTESLELVLHRVPYDFDTAAAKVLAAGLPPRWAERLRTGV